MDRPGIPIFGYSVLDFDLFERLWQTTILPNGTQIPILLHLYHFLLYAPFPAFQ
jgi:hypothetical protein